MAVYTKDMIWDVHLSHLLHLGTATTFRATHAFLAILTNNPELQTRLQKEVDEAVGDETPRLVHKEKMPYMEAVRSLLLCLLDPSDN